MRKRKRERDKEKSIDRKSPLFELQTKNKQSSASHYSSFNLKQTLFKPNLNVIKVNCILRYIQGLNSLCNSGKI